MARRGEGAPDTTLVGGRAALLLTVSTLWEQTFFMQSKEVYFVQSKKDKADVRTVLIARGAWTPQPPTGVAKDAVGKGGIEENYPYDTNLELRNYQV